MTGWTNILACPTCLSDLEQPFQNRLECSKCHKVYPINDGIAIFPDLPFERREFLFEIERYNRIARNLPKDYKGLDDSFPKARASLLIESISEALMYLNVGQGFGELEALMPKKDKVCLDQSIGFLRLAQKKKIPRLRLVNGFAERMPFKSNIFPCVVSDSVFQTVTDQKEFLIESVRVLAPKGLLLLAITYRWNYPRKPQLFPANNPLDLLHFLNELGISETMATYYDLHENIKCGIEVGNYLLIRGVKCVA